MEFHPESFDGKQEDVREYASVGYPRLQTFLEELYIHPYVEEHPSEGFAQKKELWMLTKLWNEMINTLEERVEEADVTAILYSSSEDPDVNVERAQEFAEIYATVAANLLHSLFEVPRASEKSPKPYVPKPRKEMYHHRYARKQRMAQETLWRQLTPLLVSELKKIFGPVYHNALEKTAYVYPGLFAYMVSRLEFQRVFPTLMGAGIHQRLFEKSTDFFLDPEDIDAVLHTFGCAYEDLLETVKADISIMPVLSVIPSVPTIVHAGQIAMVPHEGVTFVFTRPIDIKKGLRVADPKVTKETERRRVRTILAGEGNTFTETQAILPEGAAMVFNIPYPFFVDEYGRTSFDHISPDLIALLGRIPTDKLDAFVCLFDASNDEINNALLYEHCVDSLIETGIQAKRIVVQLVDDSLLSDSHWCVDNSQGRTVCRLLDNESGAHLYAAPLLSPENQEPLPPRKT